MYMKPTTAQEVYNAMYADLLEEGDNAFEWCIKKGWVNTEEEAEQWFKELGVEPND